MAFVDLCQMLPKHKSPPSWMNETFQWLSSTKLFGMFPPCLCKGKTLYLCSGSAWTWPSLGCRCLGCSALTWPSPGCRCFGTLSCSELGWEALGFWVPDCEQSETYYDLPWLIPAFPGNATCDALRRIIPHITLFQYDACSGRRAAWVTRRVLLPLGWVLLSGGGEVSWVMLVA